MGACMDPRSAGSKLVGRPDGLGCLDHRGCGGVGDEEGVIVPRADPGGLRLGCNRSGGMLREPPGNGGKIGDGGGVWWAICGGIMGDEGGECWAFHGGGTNESEGDGGRMATILGVANEAGGGGIGVVGGERGLDAGGGGIGVVGGERGLDASILGATMIGTGGDEGGECVVARSTVWGE